MTRAIRTALIIPALLLVLAIISPRAVLEAQEPKAPRYEAPQLYKGEKISVDFKDTDLQAIINIIGEFLGKKIVVADDVDISGKKVTLKLKDAPWDQVLDMALAAKNLGFDDSGEVLTIHDLPTLLKIQADRKRLAAEKAAGAQHPAPLARKVFTPKYAPVGYMAGELSKLKSERGKILAIGNDIYVEDEPEAIAAMSKALIDLDRVAPQVLIEARIVEADAAFREALAANWKSGQAEPARAMKEAGESEAQAKPAAIAYDFISQDKFQPLKAILADAQGQGPTRTLSAPRILTPTDKEVHIKQGTQIPYKTRSSYNGPGPNVQYKEVVMELTAKPHIEEDGQSLTLDLKIAGDPINTSLPEAYADISEAAARLQLKDGQTIVIGGIVTKGESPENRPAGGRSGSLSDWLFKDHAARNIEMLIFLTATIVPVNI